MRKKNILIIIVLVIGSLVLLGASITAVMLSKNTEQANSSNAEVAEDDDLMNNYTDMLKVYYRLETIDYQVDQIKEMAKKINDKMLVFISDDAGTIMMDGSA